MKTAMIAALLAAAQVQAPADPPLEFSLGTVEGLLSACTFSSPEQAEVEYHFGTCIGFIRGIRVAFETLGLAQGTQFICPPQGVTENGVLRDAVVAEIRSGSHAMTDISTIVVVDALKKLYPCPTAA